mmetsp:Transcript_16017/g.38998  ORF Transcript_16017/g.38998 Transcript_16017/m.38998 type:complete len:220 (+) Transcript_16017:354-1013(+)
MRARGEIGCGTRTGAWRSACGIAWPRGKPRPPPSPSVGHAAERGRIPIKAGFTTQTNRDLLMMTGHTPIGRAAHPPKGAARPRGKRRRRKRRAKARGARRTAQVARGRAREVGPGHLRLEDEEEVQDGAAEEERGVVEEATRRCVRAWPGVVSMALKPTARDRSQRALTRPGIQGDPLGIAVGALQYIPGFKVKHRLSQVEVQHRFPVEASTLPSGVAT